MSLTVPVSGAVTGQPEEDALVAVAKRRWFTEGPACAEFAGKLRDATGLREVILTNSGSSANLLALTALTAEELGERRIQPGDEVITTALGFPTTLNPILQVGARPVFIDVTLPEMNADVSRLEDALSPKTKAVIFAHTLGVPFDTAAVRAFCDRHGLWMVEDCCDALGSEGIMRGDFNTLSFFPAHQITCGEGGAVLTGNPKLAKYARSFRDWGRDCWCPPGKDNSCGIRFRGELDHKYTFVRVGYNLKMTEMQAAIGAAQMDRLYGFTEARMTNHRRLYERLCDGPFEVRHDYRRVISYFGFSLLCPPEIDRREITRWLDKAGVGTRSMFGGNLLRQAAYAVIHSRTAGSLENTERIHERAFWIGCWPGLNDEQLDYAAAKVKEFVYDL